MHHKRVAFRRPRGAGATRPGAAPCALCLAFILSAPPRAHHADSHASARKSASAVRSSNAQQQQWASATATSLTFDNVSVSESVAGLRGGGVALSSGGNSCAASRSNRS